MIYCHLDNPLLRFLAQELIDACTELAEAHKAVLADKQDYTKATLRRRVAEVELRLASRRYQSMGRPSRYVDVAAHREAEVRGLKHAASHAKHTSTTGKAAPNRTTNQEKLRRKDHGV